MKHPAFARRLLVGLDGHEPDVHLIRYASMVARLDQPLGTEATEEPLPPDLRRADAEVRFVYLFPRMKGATRSTCDRRVRAALRSQVNTYFTVPSSYPLPIFSEARGEAEGIAIGYDVLRGDVFERLPALAGDFDSDLLLVGQSTWPSTIGARVAMEAPCPAWLVPSGSAPVLRRLLVPCDFSDRSAAALRTAIEIARRWQQAKCFVLHVYWTGSRFIDAQSHGQDVRQLRQAYDQFMAPINRHGVTVEPLFVEGREVAPHIDRAARDQRVDLVVISSRGRTRSASWLLPSITEQVIRQCSVSFLVLRATNQPLGLVQGLRERLREPVDLHFS
jgi:nucleotide-binding universal stress UspA family protein